jgi:hypothetical protein
VLARHGKRVYSELSPCLGSIVERQEFARFHFHEARDALADFMATEHSSSEVLDLIFGREAESTDSYRENSFKAKAHLVACIQNMHSVLDILGHVIYYSLNLKTATRDRDITLNHVFRSISKIAEYRHLEGQLQGLMAHEDYRYLNALVNRSKHKSVISPSLNMNMRKPENECKEFAFPHFRHNNRDFQKRLAYEFVESEFDRQGKRVIEIGTEVNRLVSSAC